MLAPLWDRDFASNRVHGSLAQQQRMRLAVGYCKERRTAVDVGAHIGIWTAYLVGQFTRVIAFEPVAENMDCLERNCGDLGGVVAYQCALGHDRGVVDMERHGENSGCWRVKGGVGVEVYRLDAFQLEDVDLLKIDVEGWEGNVLKGAEATLERCKPVVVIEDNGLGQRFYGAEWVDPKPILREHRYQMRTRQNKDEIWSQ